MMKRARTARGFTLVELMVVVAIIGVAGAMGFSAYQRGARAEGTPRTARALYGMVSEARHAALALGTQTRVRISAGSFISEQRMPNGTVAEMGRFPVPPTVQVCTPQSGGAMGTIAPSAVTCPVSAETTVCIAGSGEATFSTTASSTDWGCPTTTRGAKLFLRDASPANHEFKHPHKIVVFGVTGLAKVLDRW